MLTFGDRQKSDGHHTIPMSPAHVVVDIAKGHVQGMIFLVTCGDRHSSFVCPQDNGGEHGAMSPGILRNFILSPGHEPTACEQTQNLVLTAFL